MPSTPIIFRISDETHKLFTEFLTKFHPMRGLEGKVAGLILENAMENAILREKILAEFKIRYPKPAPDFTQYTTNIAAFSKDAPKYTPPPPPDTSKDYKPLFS